MKLTFHPADGDAQSWEFQLGKFRVAEREEMERRSGLSWGEFKQKLLADHTRAVKALLFVLIRRAHPKYRWDDLDFSDDELTVETTLDDLQRDRAAIEAASNLSASDKAELLEHADEVIGDFLKDKAAAIEDGAVTEVEPGKAPRKTSGTTTRSTSPRSSTSRRTAKPKP